MGRWEDGRSEGRVFSNGQVQSPDLLPRGVKLAAELLVCFRLEIGQVLRQDQQAVEFRQRSQGNVQESVEFALTPLAGAFRKIRRNRNCRASSLRSEPVNLSAWPSGGGLIYLENQPTGRFPSAESLEPFHGYELLGHDGPAKDRGSCSRGQENAEPGSSYPPILQSSLSSYPPILLSSNPPILPTNFPV